jgi:hypothetical protein
VDGGAGRDLRQEALVADSVDRLANGQDVRLPTEFGQVATELECPEHAAAAGSRREVIGDHEQAGQATGIAEAGRRRCAEGVAG